MNVNCLLIDDEAIARRGLEKYISQIPFLNLVSSANSAVTVLEKINEEKIDLIFLDIQMPQLTGLEFLKLLKQPPVTILTTAFPNYALQGFELDVLDYLLKPISFSRFLKACNKAKDYLDLLKAPDKETDYFFIKADNKIEKIEMDKILFIESAENYSNIYTTSKKYMTLLSLQSLEDYLNNQIFLRVHRSYIVSIGKIDSVEQDEINISSYKIPISRKNKDAIMEQILKNRLLKRK